jgi:cytoskeletal protein CcmA (bactofilin family)
MIDEDYFSAGGSAELDKRVEGDAFLAGGRVAVRGPVKGDAVLAGGDINLSDTVGQNLYAAGGSVVLSSQVAGNARIAGQVTISQRGGIVGKTVGAAGFRLSGRVGRYLVVYAESVRIDGEVGGDLRIAARSVEIGPDAKIYGKLIYRSPHPAKIDPAAVIAGGVTHVELSWPRQEVDSIARCYGFR